MMTADSLATPTPWGDTVGWVTESPHLGTWRLTATNQADIAGPCDLIEHVVWETLDLVRAAGWRGTQRPFGSCNRWHVSPWAIQCWKPPLLISRGTAV